MSQKAPRIRMFAGPNGSGKSTIKSVISPTLLGVYINPDEIEERIQEQGFLNFQTYFGVKTVEKEVLDFFADSSLLKIANLLDKVQHLRFINDTLEFAKIEINSYFAAVIADFIRHKLIEVDQSFTFETVMSMPDKIELLRKAQKKGYRTYPYYVATEDPEINISRVKNRVKMGGHPVPKDKIVSRYYRSLDLLMEAVQTTPRAYFFDNSIHQHIWLAEVTHGQTLEMKSSQMPAWFKKALWDKFLNLN